MASRGFITLFFALLIPVVLSTVLVAALLIPGYFSERFRLQSYLDEVSHGAVHLLPNVKAAHAFVEQALGHHLPASYVKTYITSTDVTLTYTKNFLIPLLRSPLPLVVKSRSMIAPVNTSLFVSFDNNVLDSLDDGSIESHCRSQRLTELKKIALSSIEFFGLLSNSALGVSFLPERETASGAFNFDTSRPLSRSSQNAKFLGRYVLPDNTKVHESDCRALRLTVPTNPSDLDTLFPLSEVLSDQPARLTKGKDLSSLLLQVFRHHMKKTEALVNSRKERHIIMFVRFDDTGFLLPPNQFELDAIESLVSATTILSFIAVDVAPSHALYKDGFLTKRESAANKVRFRRYLTTSHDDFINRIFPKIKQETIKSFIAQ